MGKSQFLLLNPARARAHEEAVEVIGVQKVRISIRARRNKILHLEAGYMTDALFSSNKSLDVHGWSIHDPDQVNLLLKENYSPFFDRVGEI